MKYNWKEIAGILLSAALILLLIEYVKSEPLCALFLAEHKVALLSFAGVLAVVAIVTGTIHDKAADSFGDKTERSVNAARTNISIWCAFWLCWCGYNVWALFSYPFALALFTLSFVLTNAPGICLFVITWSIRRDELKEWEVEQKNLSFSDVVAIEKAYRFAGYSGFYGVLTLPLYLVACAVYYFLVP